MLDIKVGHTKCGISDSGFASFDKLISITYSSEIAVPLLYPVKFDQTLSVAHN